MPVMGSQEQPKLCLLLWRSVQHWLTSLPYGHVATQEASMKHAQCGKSAAHN
jgi:hypothetical protein